MVELILAIGFAVFVSAGCSLFEAVLYSVPLRHLETLVRAGKPGGKILRELRGQVDRPIAAILSLNTIAHTAGAAFAGASAAAVFGPEFLGYFSAIFTAIILIFSEIIPKTVGVVYGKSLTSFVAYPLKGLVWGMTPVIWVCSLITRMIERNKPEEGITAEEIQVMAGLSLQTGGIKSYQERAIQRILTLHQKRVKDVMTPRTVIFSLSEHLTLAQAIEVSRAWEHSRIPVYDRDMEDIVGIVLTKELLFALAQGKREIPLTEIMRPVQFVAETARLHSVLAEFLEQRQHLFVVIDEYGGLAGLVSLEDVLEEILGREIVDESDQVADKRQLARKRRSMLTKRPGKP